MGYRKYNYVGEVPGGKAAHVSETTWAAPQLSKALFTAPVGQHDVFRTSLERQIDQEHPPQYLASPDTFDEELRQLLGHIQERLEMGLLEAWVSEDGYGFLANQAELAKLPPGTPMINDGKLVGQAIFDEVSGLIFWSSAEEQWARAFSEHFVFMSYNGPGQAYATYDDIAFYRSFPTVYPLTQACQHFSTFCCLSRGISIDELGGFGLGCTGNVVKYKAFERHEITESICVSGPPEDIETHPVTSAAPVFASVQELIRLGVTPGSVLVFNPGGSGHPQQNIPDTKDLMNHVGSVFRVGVQSGIQFADTGVLLGSSEGQGPTGDHAFRTSGHVPKATSCVGVGILRASTDEALESAAEALAKARPIGLARLALIKDDKGGEKVVFVSKMLHMTYAISRYIWSLRELPVAGVRAVWVIVIPKGKKWTSVLMSSNIETASPAELLDGATEKDFLTTHYICGRYGGQMDIGRLRFSTMRYSQVQPGGRAIGAEQAQSQNPIVSSLLKLETGEKQDVGTLDKWVLANFNDQYVRRITQKSDQWGVVNQDRTGVSVFDPDETAQKERDELAAIRAPFEELGHALSRAAGAVESIVETTIDAALAALKANR